MVMIMKLFPSNLLLRSIILILFTSLLINCSKDDDSESTFLERFDNTTWVEDDGDAVDMLYLKFHNNIVAPFEFWQMIELDCYYNYIWSPEEELELIENSRNTLIYKSTGSSDSVTYTVVGETIKYVYSSSPTNGYTYEFTLSKTSNTITDGLTICN